MQVSFSTSRRDFDTIRKIVDRAERLADKIGVPLRKAQIRALAMDVIACHANGCPLRLEELLAADDFNFSHDVWGIMRHIDRKTGQLTSCFVPRFANVHEGAAS